MSKRTFYEIFKPAWHESFIPSNIQGGFQKVGIWPFNLPLVLDLIIQRSTTPLQAEDEHSKPLPTPMTSKSIHRAQKIYKSNPTKENLNVILKSQERLAAQHEVDKHMCSGLLETIKNEKQQRQRGKRLNLIGGEDSGAQLFHSWRVHAALAYEAEKEAKATAEKTEKVAKKVKVQENKLLKRVEAQEKALQHHAEKGVKAQAKAAKLAEKKAQKTRFKLTGKDKMKSLIVVLPYKKTLIDSARVESFAEEIEIVPEGRGSNVLLSRKRNIYLPQRYKN
jgi:hypothetical protein